MMKRYVKLIHKTQTNLYTLFSVYFSYSVVLVLCCNAPNIETGLVFVEWISTCAVAPRRIWLQPSLACGFGGSRVRSVRWLGRVRQIKSPPLIQSQIFSLMVMPQPRPLAAASSSSDQKSQLITPIALTNHQEPSFDARRIFVD